MSIIAIANQKGGVGKTTSIRNIFEHRPDSHGAEGYLALCKEILKKGRTDMNKAQRVVLIIGAIALLIAIFTTPEYNYFSGGAMFSRSDLGEGILRAIAVIGATVFVTYALKDKKEKNHKGI